MKLDKKLKGFFDQVCEDIDFYNVETGNLDLEVMDDILDIIKVNLFKFNHNIKDERNWNNIRDETYYWRLASSHSRDSDERLGKSSPARAC